MRVAVRLALLLGTALLVPACNLTFTGDMPAGPPAPGPSGFQLELPLDLGGVQLLSPQFAWSTEPTAQSYRLQLSSASDWGQDRGAGSSRGAGTGGGGASLFISAL